MAFARQSGFTLIEMLMVMAVIGILAAIIIGISSGVRDSQARAKAKGELAILAQVLEQYKSTHGDYPWAQTESPVSSGSGRNGNAEELFRALVGWTEFRGGQQMEKAQVPSGGPRPFVDISRLTYVSLADGVEDEYKPDLPIGEAPTNIVFMDPWGRPYVYAYKSSPESDWATFGYLLFSSGPDGEFEPIPGTGIRGNRTGSDIDNIYAGE